MTRNELLAAKLLSAYRAAHPESRAVGLVKLIRNGSTVKQYGCVLCGAAGPTYSARWRETKRSRSWCADHMADHVARALAEHIASLSGERQIACDAEAEGRSAEAIAIRLQEGM